MFDKIRQYFKSRTIKVATFIALLGVLESNFSFLQDSLGDYYGLTWVCFSMIMAYLRLITTQPIEEK